MQGVAWRELGERLIGDSEYNLKSSQWSYPLEKIEEEHQSDDRRLRGVIERWLQGEGLDENPSWRTLIWRLDDATETSTAANPIRYFAEPLPGKSCDSKSHSCTVYKSCLTSDSVPTNSRCV